MGLNASKIKENESSNKVQQEPLDPGVYPARLVQLIDLGVQPQRAYQGKEKPPAHEIMLTYEFVDEFLKDEEGNDIEDKPRWYSETIPLFSLKADRAKSTLRYNAMDPDGVHGGDFAALVGTPVNVTLVHNVSGDKTYVNVAGIAAMRPRDVSKCPELINEPKVFDLDNPDLEVLSSLPDWIKEKIKGNLHFKGSVLDKLLGGDPIKSSKKAKEVPQEEVEEEFDDSPY